MPAIPTRRWIAQALYLWQNRLFASIAADGQEW
jgi:hypothetical protein